MTNAVEDATAPPKEKAGDQLGGRKSSDAEVMNDVVSTFNEINNMKTITQRLK